MAEVFTARVWVLGDDIDTDIVIPTEYLALKTVQDMTPYAFSPLRPELAGQIKPGDVIVAGSNFGCGSSREQAPAVLKALGVQAVIAKSFARIFFRNAINIGLPVIVCRELYDHVEDGEEMELSLTEGVARVHGEEFPCTRLNPYMQQILNQGGLLASLNEEA